MVTSGRPICVTDNVEMHCIKNGAVVEHMATDGAKALQAADLYECPTCKIRVISGFGQQCLVNHWENGKYKATRDFEAGLFPITQSWMSLEDKEEYGRYKARTQVPQSQTGGE